MAIQIFLYLYKHRRCTARQIANEFECSVRTVYRYIDKLSCYIPLTCRVGVGGAYF
jgi:predicted DNA-binding transcriptional regulator YafY